MMASFVRARDLLANARKERETVLLFAAILAMAAFEAVFARGTIFSDGISYLEIADDYLAGRWSQAINPYWSPLYSWLLATGKIGLSPFSLSERTVLHLLNFVVFAGGLAAFHYFFCRLLLHFQVLPTRSVRLIAYLTFSWGSLGLIGIWRPMPDLLVALLTYAACGLMLHIRADNSTGKALALGAVLGLGFLAKAAFLPVGVLFIVGAKRIRQAALAAAGLLVVISPWVTVLSLSQGKFTLGNSGPLNYAWEVSGARRWTHWNGVTGDTGRPLHPTRRLSDSPELYEFAAPVPGMYPPWRDPSYWHDGLALRFDLAKQVRAAWHNLRLALFWSILCPALLGAIPAVFRIRAFVPSLGRIWFVLLPCACGVILYTLVFVESRYVAPYLTVLGFGAFIAGYSLANSREIRLAGATVALVSAVCLNGVSLAVYATLASRGLFRDRHTGIAREASRYGIHGGTQLAYVGMSVNAYWVRLAGARIVCEVPVSFERDNSIQREMVEGRGAVNSFWRATPEARATILGLMRQTGAEAAVADGVPPWAPTEGWQELRTGAPRASRDDRIFVYRLDADGLPK